MIYEPHHWQWLLQLARASIEHGFEHDAPLHASNRGVPAVYAQRRACYVGLTVQGDNRGCLGNTVPVCTLYDSVRINAYKAVFRDDRFSKPGRAVLSTGSLRVFIFIDSRESSIKGIATNDSIAVSFGNARAVMLSAYRGSRNNEDFVKMTSAKAGLSTIPLEKLKIIALKTEMSHLTPIKEIGAFKHEWY